MLANAVRMVVVMVQSLLDMGYSATDVISTLFRVVRNYPGEKMEEFIKLEFLRVRALFPPVLKPDCLHSTDTRNCWGNLISAF
jgi:Replication factor C C-terminal domain